LPWPAEIIIHPGTDRILSVTTQGTGWVPREMRHTFVSLLSARGVPVEAIALLAGHNQTSTTELVYRHQIVPALTRGAEVMDEIFG
jgi:integrase